MRCFPLLLPGFGHTPATQLQPKLGFWNLDQDREYSQAQRKGPEMIFWLSKLGPEVTTLQR